MEQEISENIRKLAETLRKSGIASSELDAIEKAKQSLRAQEVVKKGQDLDNYFKNQRNRTVNDLLKEDNPKEGNEMLTKDKDSIEIKQLDSIEENTDEEEPDEEIDKDEEE